jgi:hypothetical protein
MLRFELAVMLIAGGIGCSSSLAGNVVQGDASPASDASPMDAGDGPEEAAVDAPVSSPHPPFPQASLAGGSVMTSPQIVSVSFAGTTPHVHAFADWVGGSAWLGAVGADYGVKGTAHLKSVVLPQSVGAVVTGDDVVNLLTTSIAPGGPLPAPNPDTLYLIEYPPGTTVGAFQGITDTCSRRWDGTSIGGYHFNVGSGSSAVKYAVVPNCPDETDDEVWIAASHEFIEAATDPIPNTGYGVWSDKSGWSYMGGEIGDLCSGHWLTEAGHTVQRIYSNSAAAAGGSPCVPAPPDVFYGVSSAPDGPSAAPGATVTVPLSAWSSGKTTPWIVDARPSNAFDFVPAVSLSASRANDGDTVTLKLSVPADAPHGGVGVVYVYSYRSQATAGADFSTWPVAVFAK